MTDAPLLVVENLNAFYGTAQALEDVSFEIAGGAMPMIALQSVVLPMPFRPRIEVEPPTISKETSSSAWAVP